MSSDKETPFPTGSNNQQSSEIVRRFKWAVKQVERSGKDCGHGTKRKRKEEEEEEDREEESQSAPASLTETELVELIRTWEPKRDIICLYVRWSRQLRRNFNMDSIATLLCLSRQCGYNPTNFLRKVKQLWVHPSQKSFHGLKFHFDIARNRKDVDDEKLSKEFLGLSVTMSLLQEQITASPGILGKTGMRQRGPRKAQAISIPLGDDDAQQTSTMTTLPNSEFHTQESFLNRIWLSISHRWIALFLLEHLFREKEDPTWSYVDALVYSFQGMAPCGPVRYEFLSPIVGYCLRFRTIESIEANRLQIREIKNNATLFFPYGNKFLSQFPSESQACIISECFHDLASSVGSSHYKKICYHRLLPLSRRWNILRAYVFHLWLRSTASCNIKKRVMEKLGGSRAEEPTKKQERVLNNRVIPSNSRDGTLIAPLEKPKISPQRRPRNGGMGSIMSSRRTAPAAGFQVLTKKHTTTVHHPPFPPGPAVRQETGGHQEAIHALPYKDHDTTDWSRFRLISDEELNGLVQSYLLIKAKNGVDIVSDLSPLEVYSADHLHDLTHCRMSGESPYYPKEKVGPVVLRVHGDAQSYLDMCCGKAFHIAREQSKYFVEHCPHLPGMECIQKLCQAIVVHGTIDKKRGIGQHRVNIGNGGQNWTNGAPCILHGLQFKKALETDKRFDPPVIMETIGQITRFAWEVASSLQNDASDHPIAPDSMRRELYSRHLNEYLSMDQSIGFEDITLVVSSLYPVTCNVMDHKDTMNDTLAGYTRTVAFNMVMIHDHTADSQPTVLHFQVIGNFRKVIGRYVQSIHQYVAPVSTHVRQYIDRWNRSVQSVYAGKSNQVPSVYNRSAYFLDDMLRYSNVVISKEGIHKQTISGEYILMEVGISRTLSLSMFIDPIVKLQKYLKFDQTMEIALVCSFLSNPFWFNWTMTTLLQRADDSEDTFHFGIHPFYDWCNCTIETFGTWQGGPYNRWSPCGGSKETVLETFGAQPNATGQERIVGENRLSQVVAVLCSHIEWINSLVGLGYLPVVDMPLSMIKARCDKTIKDIANIASCQFSHFRLGILTTILSGCGLLGHGRHLRNLMFPVKGSASFKHLCCPVADVMSPEKANALGRYGDTELVTNDRKGHVGEEHHDVFMQYLSAEIGFQVYCRDEVECLLCESHPLRSLNCRDWFRRGMCIYDCNNDGEFFTREYGVDSKWIKLSYGGPPYQFQYLHGSLVTYLPHDHQLANLALEFGNCLRSATSKTIAFKGRSSRTSSLQRTFTNHFNIEKATRSFSTTSIQTADFYDGSVVKSTTMQSLFVLGDGDKSASLDSCNNLEDYKFGKELLLYLDRAIPCFKGSSTTKMAGGCYHRDPDLDTNEVTFFPGHLDKAFAHTVWFVPIGTASFFTIVAVPTSMQGIQDPGSLDSFQEWRNDLSPEAGLLVESFLEEFDGQAIKHMRCNDVTHLIYSNTCGSVLCFPASRYYHATITPKKDLGSQRDLFIFHPLDGNMFS